jgi:citrate lyase subunit beta/citryl-CoA lyase
VDAVDAIYLNIQDHDSLRDESLQAARLGFVGKQVIHPAQIPIVHAAFTPSAERVQRAERILGFWQKAQAEGKAVVAMDGMLLEPPVIAMEELVLERARQAR